MTRRGWQALVWTVIVGSICWAGTYVVIWAVTR